GGELWLVRIADDGGGCGGDVFLDAAVDVLLGERVAGDKYGNAARRQGSVRLQGRAGRVQRRGADDGVCDDQIGERNVACIGDDELVVHAVAGILDRRAVRGDAAGDIDEGADLLQRNVGVEDRVGRCGDTRRPAYFGAENAISSFPGLINE